MVLHDVTMKYKNNIMLCSLSSWIVFSSLPFLRINAYNTSPTGGGNNHFLRRSDIAGIWRLTGKKSYLPFVATSDNIPTSSFKQKDSTSTSSSSWLNEMKPQSQPQRKKPMKEFTIACSPKSKKKTKQKESNDNNEVSDDEEEVFINVKEDGTFEQCAAIDDSSLTDDDDDSVSKSSSTSILGLSLMKGTWDFIDGKLILATDRPSTSPPSSSSTSSSSSVTTQNKIHDTILVGRVVEQISSTENTTDPQNNNTIDNSKNANATESFIDMISNNNNNNKYLSIPKGSVKIGKYMYPKNHPSFFEHPTILSSASITKLGSFQLRQVLSEQMDGRRGSNEDVQVVELFQPKDFFHKRFLLTSRPLETRRRVGDTGNNKDKESFEEWNRNRKKRAGKISSSNYDKKDTTSSSSITSFDIRTMEIELYPNGTFSTVQSQQDSNSIDEDDDDKETSGLYGKQTKILRGKWSIIGEKKDQLWMQVMRFGFGRSVSGSTFSEGRLLDKNDERSYWGTITKAYLCKKDNDDDDDEDTENQDKEQELTSKDINIDIDMDGEIACEVVQTYLEIRGSVIFGWGLEPEPIGRFTMVESTTMSDDSEEEKEDALIELEYKQYQDKLKKLDDLISSDDAKDITFDNDEDAFQ